MTFCAPPCRYFKTSCGCDLDWIGWEQAPTEYYCEDD